MIAKLLVGSGALALLLFAPAGALAQGVTIDHQEVGCIVAGQYPKMNACFAPASLVKKPKVYFRPESPSLVWYYVEMTSDAPCFSGVLLKPSKALIEKRIFYYLEAQGGASRTPEYAPVVVASEEECKKRKLPVAPLSATGPAAVFPSLPATGFVVGAGLPTAVVVGGVAAAAAVAGGAKLLTTDETTVPTPPAPPTNPPATTPPTTAPPTTVPTTTSPLLVACQATPRNGEAPLRVSFATFPSGGTGTYVFLWSFGDGGSDTNPNPSHTFPTAGVFNSTVQVTSGDQIAACSRPITVTLPPTAPPPTSPASFDLKVNLTGSGTGVVTGPGINCPSDCAETYPAGTVVTLTATPASASGFKQWTGDCAGAGSCVLTMSADKNVVAQFELIRTLTVTVTSSFGGAGTVTSNDGQIACTISGASPPPTSCSAIYLNGASVTLTATPQGGGSFFWGGDCATAVGNTCSLTMDLNKNVTTDFGPASLQTGSRGREAAARPVTWSTQLEVPDGEGQVMMNGRIASAVRPGLAAMAAAESRMGANRVEAVLVRGSGRSGTWRFDFSGQAAFKPGSLRVVAGTVALITGEAVVFRLQGRPGERVVFTFEVAGP